MNLDILACSLQGVSIHSTNYIPTPSGKEMGVWLHFHTLPLPSPNQEKDQKSMLWIKHRIALGGMGCKMETFVLMTLFL